MLKKSEKQESDIKKVTALTALLWGYHYSVPMLISVNPLFLFHPNQFLLTWIYSTSSSLQGHKFHSCLCFPASLHLIFFGESFLFRQRKRKRLSLDRSFHSPVFTCSFCSLLLASFYLETSDPSSCWCWKHSISPVPVEWNGRADGDPHEKKISCAVVHPELVKMFSNINELNFSWNENILQFRVLLSQLSSKKGPRSHHQPTVG